MFEFATATPELRSLSRTVTGFGPSPDVGLQLDRFTAKAGEVVPYRRCVFLHQRDGASRQPGCVYKRSSPDAAGSVRAQADTRVAVGRYLDRLETFDRRGHVLRWRGGRADAGAAADPVVGELLAHMSGREGIAVRIHSVVSATDEAETLLQLECDADDISEEQSLLIGFITFHLHSALAHDALDAGRQGAAVDIRLTGKEKDVLRWVVEGKTSWEIGRILSTSERTVKFHLKNIYAKLNVSNRAQAAAMVNRLRLV